MLTGSMAMNYYAEPRMTRDIDLVVELEPSTGERLIETFSPDYYVSRESVADSIAREGLFNLIHQESVIKVDFIVRKSTAFRKGEFARRSRIEIEDFSTWIVSKEDLILSKLEWAKESRSEVQRRRSQSRFHRLRHGICGELGDRPGAGSDLGRVQTMKDTTPEIEQRMHDLLMQRSGAERFRMGVEMFEAARRMVLASFPPDLSPLERNRRLYERIYGESFPSGS